MDLVAPSCPLQPELLPGCMVLTLLVSGGAVESPQSGNSSEENCMTSC